MSSDLLTCIMARALPATHTRTLNKYKPHKTHGAPTSGMRGGAGDGRLGRLGPPSADSLPGSGASKEENGWSGRPEVFCPHWPCPGHAPRPPANVSHAPPAKFVFRQSRLGGAGSARPSHCLQLGASLPLRTDAGLLSLALFLGLENPERGKDEGAYLVHLPLKA